MKYFDVPALSRLVLRFHLVVFLAIAFAPKLAAQTTNFFDGFENGMNGWQVGDSNPTGTASYWGVVNSAFGGEGVHSGTNKAYCAAVGYFTTSGPCCPNYQPYMESRLSRTIDLTGYTNASLSFWHKIPSIEGVDYDYVEVKIDNDILWSKNLPTGAAPWTQVTLSLEPYIGGSHNLQFVFYSDESEQQEGWYLDDILVTDAFTPGPPPANDNFLAAPLLSGAVGTVTGTTGSATAEAGESNDGFSATNSVWFKWDCRTNGLVTFRTGGSRIDTILCVYSGNTLLTLAPVRSPVNCDVNGDTNGGSLVSFDAVPGIYRISVRGVNNARGAIQLHWIQPVGVSVDLLPDVSLAVSKSLGYMHGWYIDRNEIPGRTLLRASTASINIGAGPLELRGSSTDRAVIQRIYSTSAVYPFRDRNVDGGTFTFHPTHGHLHFDNWLNFFIRQIGTNSEVGDVVVAGDKTSFAIIDLTPYDLTLPGAVQPDANGRGVYFGDYLQGMSVGWADVYGGYLPDQWIDVTDVPPGRYWLEARVDPENRVLESNESNNVVRIQVDLSNLAGTPANDNFVNATPLNGPSAGALGSNINATNEPGEIAISLPNDTVWYKWTAPSTMSVTISTEGSFDTVLGVYTGGTPAGLILAAPLNHYADANHNFSRVTFTANANTTYRIAVDGYNSAEGLIEISVNPAWNDNLNRPIQLTGMSGSASGSTYGATRQAEESMHAGVNGSNSIWYVWTAPTNGPFSFDTTGSGFDTLLAVYTGAAFPLTLVAENNNLSPTNTASRVTFDAVSNTTYRIAVDGFPGVYQSGIVKLGWNGPMPPTIISQPIGPNPREAGAGVQFTVGVSGTAPFHYQWRRNNTDLLNDERISGATSPTLTIGKIYLTDMGSYSVVITNAWGSVTSAPANLIVNDNPRVIYINHQTAPLGGVVTVPVHMAAMGNERTFQFSLVFDPTLLVNPRVEVGANTAGATLTVDSSQASGGKLGVTLALPAGQTLPVSSTLEIARVAFDAAAAATNGAVSTVGFGNQPVARSVLDTNGTLLVALFVAGSVTLEDWTATANCQILGNGSFQLSLIGPPSRTYVIEATTNLTIQSWVPVSTNQTSLGGLLQFLDTDATNHPYRFFRARMVQ